MRCVSRRTSNYLNLNSGLGEIPKLAWKIVATLPPCLAGHVAVNMTWRCKIKLKRLHIKTVKWKIPSSVRCNDEKQLSDRNVPDSQQINAHYTHTHTAS